jgi:glutamate-1-semialdehyde 2,1-aminomutase
MRQVAPDGPVYQAGTLSGNPLAMAAGLATLTALESPGVYPTLDRQAQRLTAGLAEAAHQANVDVQLVHVGSMVGCFFSSQPVSNHDQATAQDTAAFARFFQAMLDGGVMLPPSAFETWFVSLAHDDAAIDATIEAAGPAFAAANAR